MLINKNDALLLLKSFEDGLKKDGFSTSEINFINTARNKIKNNYSVRKEVSIIYQQFCTLNLIEKKVLSRETKEILYQLKKITYSGSIWTKMNDLMTANNWPGR